MASKTAFITGGNRGIGFEIGRQLGELGWGVFLGSRNPGNGDAAAKALRDKGLNARAVPIDVSDAESIVQAYGMVSGEIGKLDVLVNNAGVVLDERTGILDVPAGVIVQTININALGALFVIQAFRTLLRRGSRVINISSGAGEIGNGMGTYAPVYSISKTTLNAITCQCAHALHSRGVAVNAVCPGWVRTDMGGRSAPRSVEQGAETAVWLATDAPLTHTGKFWRDKRVIPW